MASPHHSNTVVATCSFDAEKTSNVTPACRKDDARRDAAYQQQQQCAPDVVRHAALERLSCAFRCTTCDRQFASRKYLSMHAALHKMAAEPPPTLSPVAVAVAVGSDVGATRRHRRTGSAPEQWSCPVCDKTFAQKSNFRNHARTHSDERPYVCIVCLIGFKERYHLKKHMLFKHSPGQLNEACRLCGKRFKDVTAVRAHERTHSDARPYACSLCDKMFKTSECLWHHENRSKTCGRTISVGSGSRPSYCCEVSTPTGGQSSSRRRQRHDRAVRQLLPSTTLNSRPSTTEAAVDVVAKSPPRFVELSNTKAPTSSPLRNATCCTEASGAKPETEVAEIFDRNIGVLWKTLASDGVMLQSIYDDNVDTNFCTSANCFDNLTATTPSAAVGVSRGDAEVVGRHSEQICNAAAPTDMSNDHHLQSAFTVVSSDAAFQTVSGFSERRPLCQTTSAHWIQQTKCVYDEQLIRGCLTLVDAYENGRSSKLSLANPEALVDRAGTSRAFSGSYLPTAVVAPIKCDHRRGITPSPRQHVISSPPANTFHLPPIETLSPGRRLRRPTSSTWSWSSLDVSTDRVYHPYQQCPTVVMHQISPPIVRNQLIRFNKPENIGGNYTP